MRLKLFTLLIMMASVSYGQSSLQHEHFVDDYAGLFTKQQADDLATSIKSFWDTAQIAVVTVKSLEGREIQEYATALFNKWGIGSREKNNGLLFLIAPTEHKAWAATGRGIQGYLTDAKSASLQREFLVPEAKKGNYYAGAKATLLAYIGALRLSGQETSVTIHEEGDYWWMVIPGMFFVGMGGIFIAIRRRKKRREAEEAIRRRIVDDSNNRSSRLGYIGGYSSGGYVGSGYSTGNSDSYSSGSSYISSGSSYSSDSDSGSSYSGSSDSGSNSSSFDFGGGSNDGGGGGSDW